MRLVPTCALLLLSLQYIGVAAYSKVLLLDHAWPNHQKCVDIRSVTQFQPDSVSSLILTFNGGQGIVSAVVFELGDEYLGGMRRPGSNEVCTDTMTLPLAASIADQHLEGDILHKAEYPKSAMQHITVGPVSYR